MVCEGERKRLYKMKQFFGGFDKGIGRGRFFWSKLELVRWGVFEIRPETTPAPVPGESFVLRTNTESYTCA